MLAGAPEVRAGGFSVIAGFGRRAQRGLIAQGRVRARIKKHARLVRHQPVAQSQVNLFQLAKAFRCASALPLFRIQVLQGLRGSLRPSFWEAVYFTGTT